MFLTELSQKIIARKLWKKGWNCGEVEFFDKQCLLFFKTNSLVRVLKFTLTHIMIYVNRIKTIVNLSQLWKNLVDCKLFIKIIGILSLIVKSDESWNGTIIENIRKSKSTLMFLAICHKLQVLQKNSFWNKIFLLICAGKIFKTVC